MTPFPDLGPRPDELSAGPSATVSRFAGPDLSFRRRLLGYAVLALIPVSAVTAIIVISLMASSAAAATGGCGGG
jgi:hypothetical protein